MATSPSDRLRWLKRALWALLGLFVLMIALLAGSIAFDAWFGRSSTEFTNVLMDQVSVNRMSPSPATSGQTVRKKG